MKDLQKLADQIKQGLRLNYDQAVELVNTTPAADLHFLANQLREHFQGNHFDLCSIINARSGRCSEDCKWCSQSRFHKTDIDIYPLVGASEAIALARHNTSKNVKRFSLVTSGRTMTPHDMKSVCSTYRQLRALVDTRLCASLGLLNQEQMEELRESGVERYHCNLETAPSFFPALCSTHTTDEKIATLRAAQSAGLEICSGGIIGMGETMEQRIELAVTLQDLGVKSIPVNVLNPIKGTALENTPTLSDSEVLTSIAMFRIINPQAYIRLAGGRTVIEHLTAQLLKCGVNAAIVGDMLTTVGSQIDADKELFTANGFVFQ